MKNCGEGKVRPLPNPAEEQVEELLGLLRSADCLPSPSIQLFEAPVDGLGGLGFEDIPECEGISSSVRQCAINPSAIQKAERPGEKVTTEDKERPSVMVTFIELLPANAEELMAQFGLNPMQPDRLPATVDSNEIH